jgi:hypothetical protein
LAIDLFRINPTQVFEIQLDKAHKGIDFARRFGGERDALASEPDRPGALPSLALIECGFERLGGD